MFNELVEWTNNTHEDGTRFVQFECTDLGKEVLSEVGQKAILDLAAGHFKDISKVPTRGTTINVNQIFDLDKAWAERGNTPHGPLPCTLTDQAQALETLKGIEPAKRDYIGRDVMRVRLVTFAEKLNEENGIDVFPLDQIPELIRQV